MAHVETRIEQADNLHANADLMAARYRLADLIEQSRNDVGVYDVLKMIELTTSAQREVNLMSVSADSYSWVGTGSTVMR
ncbi:MAG: hypothetical protein O9306_16045 [Beijerinckiaceae bacterium]|nr:hypothetical protein [Beijerinckiaceae bacterium]